ncbi:MAG TPA: hypothetical protein VLF14_10310 [Candidatus Binatia bacterium]|nr:hypothetical protein [Candidatus Binatia bacterium]
MRSKGPPFWIGVVLMATSFALYPAYLLIAFLPITAEGKIECALVGWMLSWSLFALGSALAGKEGVRYVRETLLRRRPLAPPRS